MSGAPRWYRWKNKEQEGPANLNLGPLDTVGKTNASNRCCIKGKNLELTQQPLESDAQLSMGTCSLVG